ISGEAAMSISLTTVSLVMVVSFISVLLCLLFDEALQVSKLVLPHVTVVRQPIVDVAKRSGVELVETVASHLDLAHQRRFAQDAKVLGDRGPADGKVARDAAHGLATLPEHAEDRAPRRVGERLEDVIRSRRLGNRSVT